MFTFRKAVIIAFALLSAWSPISALGQTDKHHGTIAEVAWVERVDDRNSIFFAEFNGERWQRIEAPLYSSKNPLSTPAIGTKSDGRKLLIWTEQKNSRAVLMRMDGHIHTSAETSNAFAQASSTSWSIAKEFYAQQMENLAANILVDSKQQFWVFWSSSSLTNTDIFMQRELVDGWRPVEQVNKKNTVPDYHPTAKNDIDGNIHVQWTSYDLKAGRYVKKVSVFSIDGHKLNSDTYDYASSLKVHIANEQNLVKVKTPNFLPENSRVLIHFPGNNLIQSVLR